MPKVPVAKEGEVLDMLGEVWKQWEDSSYFFSNCGRVKRKTNKGEYLKEGYDKMSWNRVKRRLVKIKGKQQHIARCVYTLFVGEIPKGYVVHHKDNCYFNNDVRNLEILTSKELGHKIGVRNRRRKKVYCLDNGKYYKSAKECGEDVGTDSSTICHICNGQVKNPCVRVKWVKEN